MLTWESSSVVLVENVIIYGEKKKYKYWFAYFTFFYQHLIRLNAAWTCQNSNSHFIPPVCFKDQRSPDVTVSDEIILDCFPCGWRTVTRLFFLLLLVLFLFFTTVIMLWICFATHVHQYVGGSLPVTLFQCNYWRCEMFLSLTGQFFIVFVVLGKVAVLWRSVQVEERRVQSWHAEPEKVIYDGRCFWTHLIIGLRYVLISVNTLKFENEECCRCETFLFFVYLEINELQVTDDRPICYI